MNRLNFQQDTPKKIRTSFENNESSGSEPEKSISKNESSSENQSKKDEHQVNQKLGEVKKAVEIQHDSYSKDYESLALSMIFNTIKAQCPDSTCLKNMNLKVYGPGEEFAIKKFNSFANQVGSQDGNSKPGLQEKSRNLQEIFSYSNIQKFYQTLTPGMEIDGVVFIEEQIDKPLLSFKFGEEVLRFKSPCLIIIEVGIQSDFDCTIKKLVQLIKDYFVAKNLFEFYVQLFSKNPSEPTLEEFYKAENFMRILKQKEQVDLSEKHPTSKFKYLDWGKNKNQNKKIMRDSKKNEFSNWDPIFKDPIQVYLLCVTNFDKEEGKQNFEKAKKLLPTLYQLNQFPELNLTENEIEEKKYDSVNVKLKHLYFRHNEMTEFLSNYQSLKRNLDDFENSNKKRDKKMEEIETEMTEMKTKVEEIDKKMGEMNLMMIGMFKLLNDMKIPNPLEPAEKDNNE